MRATAAASISVAFLLTETLRRYARIKVRTYTHDAYIYMCIYMYYIIICAYVYVCLFHAETLRRYARIKVGWLLNFVYIYVYVYVLYYYMHLYFETHMYIPMTYVYTCSTPPHSSTQQQHQGVPRPRRPFPARRIRLLPPERGEKETSTAPQGGGRGAAVVAVQGEVIKDGDACVKYDTYIYIDAHVRVSVDQSTPPAHPPTHTHLHPPKNP